MYHSASAGIIIVVVIIMLIIKPLFKIIVDVFDKSTKDDHDAKK